MVPAAPSTQRQVIPSMPQVRIQLAQEGDAPAVEAFNERLRAAGAHHRLTASRPFRDYVLHPASPVRLERYFAWVDGALRGGVMVKRLPFWIAGYGMTEVAFYGHPVSEGVVNPEFGFLGLMLQKFVTARYPLVYGLGTGSLDMPVARVMQASGWTAQPVPFWFRVFRARPFLQQLQYLRQRGAWTRTLADVAAWSGLGSFGFGLWHALQALGGRHPWAASFRAEAVETWGAWADDLWLQVRESYALIGDRSAATLATLYPDGHPHLRRLRVLDAAGAPVGWAIWVVARQRESRYFGNLNLGTLVDALALPGREVAVVRAALQAMRRAGADLAVTNLSAAVWNRACRRAGMWTGPTNFFLFLAPALQARLAHLPHATNACHFTRGDGDGPINLF